MVIKSTKLEDDKDLDQDDLDRKDSIKSVIDVLQSLSKAIKTLKLYPDTSRLRQKFITELVAKFKGFLDEYGDLILKIKKSEFFYMGEVVYSNPSLEESIAFKLYGDGIRELTFTEGLSEEELFDFIDIVTRDYKKEGEDDDTVTKLWEKDFKSIRYAVVEEGKDDNLLLQIPEKVTTTDSSKNALLKAYKQEMTAEPKGESLLQPAGVEVEIEQIYGKPFSEIFTLTPEEITKVHDEMEIEKKMDLVSELVDILFHILRIEHELDSYSEFLKHLEKIIKTLLLAGDYKRVLPILTTLKTFIRDGNNFTNAHAQEAEKIIDALGEEDFLHQLMPQSKFTGTEDLDSISMFISMLNKNAIIPIANMVGILDNMKARRLFCDVLALLAKDNIELLYNKLEDDKWYVVRNIVYVLGKIGDIKSIPYLKKIKDHIEARVRKEIVHALVEIKSEDAKDILIDFLNDDNNTVRIAALRYLMNMSHQKALPIISDIISRETFDTKDIYEKKEFFEALGKLGNNDVLPFLRETLMKRSKLFGKSKIEERRLYAAFALKKMSTKESMEILKEGSLSSDKGVRKICEDAMQIIQEKR